MKKFLQVAAILMALFMLWYMACAGMAYAGPTEERVDLTEYKYVNSTVCQQCFSGAAAAQKNYRER